MPSASARLFIVVAVPIVLQYPVDGADDATNWMKPSSSISPAASSSRAFHTIVPDPVRSPRCQRSEEHTSELQSLMRISYAVFCLKKKTTQLTQRDNTIQYPPRYHK